MLILVSGATRTVGRYRQLCGRLVEPAGQHRPEKLDLQPGRWAMDNGAFRQFDQRLYLDMLARYSRSIGCLFVAVPDVVGDAAATKRQWRDWAPRVRAFGYRLAYVAQDAAEPCNVVVPPWDELDCLFIGGTTGYKLGDEAAETARVARRRGKWLHMGRVNSRRRLAYAARLGCDSVDGTGFSRWPDTNLALAERWLAEIDSQPCLPTEGADGEQAVSEVWRREVVVAGRDRMQPMREAR